jgi:hypothetical protein
VFDGLRIDAGNGRKIGGPRRANGSLGHLRIPAGAREHIYNARRGGLLCLIDLSPRPIATLPPPPSNRTFGNWSFASAKAKLTTS